MEITLAPIDIADKGTLRDMIYQYEFEITGTDPGEYKYLDAYWQQPTRFPYFIKVDGQIAGFILICGYTLVIKDARTISEFYVTKEYRQKGIGKEAARLAFNLFPGKWEVREVQSNTCAAAFWNKVIAELTDNQFQQVILNNDLWQGPVQTFEYLR